MPRFDRLIEVQNPIALELLKAVEQHRLRGDLRGDNEFHFEMRDGRVRKLSVTREVAHGLMAGRLAIVEWGDPERHVVVERDAVAKIRHADSHAVRFFNDATVASA